MFASAVAAARSRAGYRLTAQATEARFVVLALMKRRGEKAFQLPSDSRLGKLFSEFPSLNLAFLDLESSTRLARQAGLLRSLLLWCESQYQMNNPAPAKFLLGFASLPDVVDCQSLS